MYYEYSRHIHGKEQWWATFAQGRFGKDVQKQFPLTTNWTGLIRLRRALSKLSVIMDTKTAEVWGRSLLLSLNTPSYRTNILHLGTNLNTAHLYGYVCVPRLLLFIFSLLFSPLFQLLQQCIFHTVESIKAFLILIFASCSSCAMVFCSCLSCCTVLTSRASSPQSRDAMASAATLQDLFLPSMR